MNDPSNEHTCIDRPNEPCFRCGVTIEKAPIRETLRDKDGLNNMGKPIPDYRRDEAYRTCREEFRMDSADSMACVSVCAEQLERDKPYEALSAASRYVDITGAYRLFAVLLIHPKGDRDET